MVQKVVVLEDLDESKGATTIRFSVDGQEYEIDLAEANATKFHEALELYIQHSRMVEKPAVVATPSRTRRRESSTAAEQRDDIAQIREWAKQEGLAVSARGRIKKEILDAYDQATGK